MSWVLNFSSQQFCVVGLGRVITVPFAIIVPVSLRLQTPRTLAPAMVTSPRLGVVYTASLSTSGSSLHTQGLPFIVISVSGAHWRVTQPS
ncbi:hypothetical protein EIP91_006262 [Steccherinum ochraceum]|uniref:Uncharacterized protein n=1 Tax=Steccherinum ochraceum TaxID=92696 RepID=A0A4R0REB5_9APHY|nr:hypothetical protein EIP91_006262 [Steccherinum ochraceum]